MVWVGRALLDRAIAARLAGGSPRVSLTDWASFEVMRDRSVLRAFAFDRHFQDQGFLLVR